MKIGIMQPYFMPYLGYWQLMNAVDKYVIFDDVNYINRGWINRNRILINGQPSYINLPISGASQNKLINEISVNNDNNLKTKLIRSVECAYGKAPYFQTVFPLLQEIISNQQNNLALFLRDSFIVINRYLKIETELIMSSDIQKNNELKGQWKILEICDKLGATDYYNAIGGQELYSFNEFNERKIDLCFLQSLLPPYKQFQNEFVPGLSIIDILMFNSVEQVRDMLNKYTLIKN